MSEQIKLERTVYKTDKVQVWVAERLGEKCIVKIFNVSNIQEANQLRLESNKMAAIDHPRIIKVQDCIFKGEGNCVSSVWLVMDYFPGGDLVNLIRRKNAYWEEQDLWHHFEKLLSAFAYLESIQIVHRDIKPQNVFVDQQEELIVGDLGTLKKLEPNSQMSITGTPAYLSPILKQHYLSFSNGIGPGKCNHDPVKSDVYSLGMTFLYMASLNDVSLLYNLQDPFETVRTWLQSLPYSLDLKSMILEMLQYYEHARPTFQELVGKYRNFLFQKRIIKQKGVLVESIQNQVVVHNFGELELRKGYSPELGVYLTIKEYKSSKLEELFEKEIQTTKLLSGMDTAFLTYYGNYVYQDHELYYQGLIVEYCPMSALDMIGIEVNPQYIEYAFSELLKVLKLLHESKIVHGCLEASRVLIASDYQIKLDTFGGTNGDTKIDTYYLGLLMTQVCNQETASEKLKYCVSIMVLEDRPTISEVLDIYQNRAVPQKYQMPEESSKGTQETIKLSTISVEFWLDLVKFIDCRFDYFW